MGLLDGLSGQVPEEDTLVGRQGSGRAPGGVPLTENGSGFAVVDVETSGLAEARDRVIEIAVITTDELGRVLDEWATLINPSGPVGPTHVHGISAVDVRYAPRFADVVGEINARLAGRALAAHKARFDLGFLRMEYERAGWSLPPVPYLCTLEASRVYLPALRRRRLVDCCRAAGVQLEGAHSALGDARATATLLASYLDPAGANPPVPHHRSLPARAASILWPTIPRTQVAVVNREVTRSAAAPTAVGTLAALLDDLPLTSAFEEGSSADVGTYIELLAEAFEDGVLTDNEAVSLAELVKVYSLSRKQVEDAHRGFLFALAYKAVEDGKVVRDEREDLLRIATILGFNSVTAKALLDEARTAFVMEKSKQCKPLPPTWPYGEPLRVGDAIAFTGCDAVERARLEGRAEAAGLRVTSSVSRKTTILVTDGANPHTSKAEAARRHNTRVVTPEVFTQLVTYAQPARQAGARTPPQSPGQRPPLPT